MQWFQDLYLNGVIMIVDNTDDTTWRRLSTTGRWCFFCERSLPAKTWHCWRSTLPSSNSTSGDAASADPTRYICVPSIVFFPIAGRLLKRIILFCLCLIIFISYLIWNTILNKTNKNNEKNFYFKVWKNFKSTFLSYLEIKCFFIIFICFI